MLPDFYLLLPSLGDGRISIDLERRSKLETSTATHVEQSKDGSVLTARNLATQKPPAPLNTVIRMVGSWGDVQPFVALGRVLKSHTNTASESPPTPPIFKAFVEENNLEFFSISGDPRELMAFMVRSPGLLPDLNGLMQGDVARHRKMVARMMEGCWRACIEGGNAMGDLEEVRTGKRTMSKETPFLADVIIANPPSFAHLHCGQKLGVPVHLMFT